MKNKTKNKIKNIGNTKRTRKEGGYALITALIFFLAATTAVLAGLSDSVLREVRVVRQESASKQSYFASESALEDVMYRVKKGKAVGATGSLSVASSSASYTLALSSDGISRVSATADQMGAQRNLEGSVEVGIGAAFDYGVQAGDGGVDINSSTIEGDAYTTGSIRAQGASTITGDAIAAGKSYSRVDSVNDQPDPPSKFITFGKFANTPDSAQSFIVSDALSITALKVFIKTAGFPTNATVRIMRDNDGKPALDSESNTITTGTLSSSLINSSYPTWQEIQMSSNPILVPGTTYWFVINANPDIENYFVVAANAAFAGGIAAVGKQATETWYDTSPSGLDQYFELSIGANQSGITGGGQYTPLMVGSAYAYNVASVSADGALYCQTGAYNNKECDTTRTDPAILAYPVSTSTIAQWKSEAASGGTHEGNYTVGATGDTVGPLKIHGSLIVNAGGTLAISGPVWVTGSIALSDGASVLSAGSSKSSVMISDADSFISGGAALDGSTGSHIMLVSTSSVDPAIRVEDSENDGVVFAPSGTIRILGGASVKAAAAYHIILSGGSTVTYDPDMSQLNFSAGGAGGPSIKSWKEVE